MTRMSLNGRVALVTGVSRRQGIGFAIASRLVARGADLFLRHHRPHDEDQPWGGDDLETLKEELREKCDVPSQRIVDMAVDLAFAAQHDGRTGGRVVLMTSGQGLGPMPGEVAYAASKAALAGVTVTLADQLADVGITLNTVNPGPVDTGYMTPDVMGQIAPMFPFGRMGEPDDPARLIEWLVSDEGQWMTGQVLNTEGGFARWRPPAPQPTTKGTTPG